MTASLCDWCNLSEVGHLIFVSRPMRAAPRGMSKKSLTYIKLKPIDIHGDTATVHILEATQTVDEDANVVLESEELEGKTLDITLHEGTAAAAP